MRTVDLVLRFAYVALVPFLLPVINAFIPITGMLVGAGIATVVALIGTELWRSKVEHIRYVGRLLSGMGELGAFYRKHPPKPLLYYILYPVLLPVILWLRVPRREFLLYRKLNLVAVAIIAATSTFDYWRHWWPELGIGQFIGATFVMFVMQLIITFMLIMPIVTTLIMLRDAHRVRLISSLVTFMVATATYGAVIAHRKQTMPIMTWVRLQARTKHARKELAVCVREHPGDIAECLGSNREIVAMRDALVAAIDSAKASGDVPAQLVAARTKLAQYYKADEAAAFQLASTREAAVIYAQHGKKPAIWLAFVNGKFTIDRAKLPLVLQRRLHLTP